MFIFIYFIGLILDQQVYRDLHLPGDGLVFVAATPKTDKWETLPTQLSVKHVQAITVYFVICGGHVTKLRSIGHLPI